MVVLGCWGFFVGLVNFYFRHGTLSDEMWCESSVTYFDLIFKSLTKKIQLEIAELEN